MINISTFSLISDSEAQAGEGRHFGINRETSQKSSEDSKL